MLYRRKKNLVTLTFKQILETYYTQEFLFNRYNYGKIGREAFNAVVYHLLNHYCCNQPLTVQNYDFVVRDVFAKLQHYYPLIDNQWDSVKGDFKFSSEDVAVTTDSHNKATVDIYSPMPNINSQQFRKQILSPYDVYVRLQDYRLFQFEDIYSWIAQFFTINNKLSPESMLQMQPITYNFIKDDGVNQDYIVIQKYGYDSLNRAVGVWNLYSELVNCPVRNPQINYNALITYANDSKLDMFKTLVSAEINEDSLNYMVNMIFIKPLDKSKVYQEAPLYSTLVDGSTLVDYYYTDSIVIPFSEYSIT